MDSVLGKLLSDNFTLADQVHDSNERLDEGKNSRAFHASR
jgi:hypothetical protein